MAPIRTVAAVWSAKAAAAASRALGRGGGTAVGGLVGLRLQPHLVRQLASGLGRGSLIVTGTNGKTTTSHLIADIARTAGLEPLANAAGSNLMRGVAATLAMAARAGGGLGESKRTLGVFEVDEAVVPEAIEALRPRVLVFTNLFRDQLDRYGEVEAVAALWREALERTAHTMTLVLNADDPSVASLGEAGKHRAVYFGVNDATLDRVKSSAIASIIWSMATSFSMKEYSGKTSESFLVRLLFLCLNDGRGRLRQSDDRHFVRHAVGRAWSRARMISGVAP